MSQAASQAHAFYRDVARTRVVWTIKDKDGYPAPKTPDGCQAQPFWSSRSRVERIIKTVPAYAGFAPYEISWDDFCSCWVPRLIKNKIKVGVNWSSKHAKGFDLDPELVLRAVAASAQSASKGEK